MKFGIDRLLGERSLRQRLAGRRLALLAHPASVTAAFGPQHGLRGDKQDNMVESPDYRDPTHGIPVHSLYGQVRRPSAAMLADCDVILVDLQDLGCRIYTFVTTLCYVLEEAARHHKAVWVLERPNPIGRPVEGLALREGCESFVGVAPMPMRHGLTLGELGAWYIGRCGLDLEYEVVTLAGWRPDTAPGFGWPLQKRAWINPSPNAPNLWMARCYPGTVFLEGTTLSEGRGTTRPLEQFGAPDLDAPALLKEMRSLAPDWLAGCSLRPCWFEPTFHKHAGRLCAGLQIHVDGPHYRHGHFRPWRLMATALKALRRLRPDYPLWRDFPYEYERDRLAVDVINGGEGLRAWVDDPAATTADLEAQLLADESAWCLEREPYLLYR
jgi:uncharacterized protein YbbC (DUF1343 family)